MRFFAQGNKPQNKDSHSFSLFQGLLFADFSLVSKNGFSINDISLAVTVLTEKLKL